MRQRTQTINMLRAQLAEFGIILPQRIYHALQFAKDCINDEPLKLPMDAQEVVFDLCDELLFLHTKILRHSRHMARIAKSEKRVALLRTIPGLGPIAEAARDTLRRSNSRQSGHNKSVVGSTLGYCL